jgi:hypothetical protein
VFIRVERRLSVQVSEPHFGCVKRIVFGGGFMRKKRVSSSFVSGEKHRRALAESGVTVMANIKKDRALVAWTKGAGLAGYIGRNCRGWRVAGWDNPFRAETRTLEERDRVNAL